MARSLVVILFFCLMSVQPVFAHSVNWQERVQRFSRYVSEHSIAQGQRTQGLEVHGNGFNRRVQHYVRALEAQARPFKAIPVPGAAN